MKDPHTLVDEWMATVSTLLWLLLYIFADQASEPVQHTMRHDITMSFE